MCAGVSDETVIGGGGGRTDIVGVGGGATVAGAGTLLVSGIVADIVL